MLTLSTLVSTMEAGLVKNYYKVSTDKEIVLVINKLYDGNIEGNRIGHINLDSISVDESY